MGRAVQDLEFHDQLQCTQVVAFRFLAALVAQAVLQLGLDVFA
jgi:hypothetical protein